jgi:hypothetical protein
MADVTGPISTLPGSTHIPPKGTCCDDHPDVLATHRVQGETDSMGSEMIDLCNECYEKHKLEIKENPTTGLCEMCGTDAVLVPYRDFEEGMGGPVYHICKPCKDRTMVRIMEELEAEDDYNNIW